MLQVRKNQHNLIKCLFSNVPNITVILGLNISSAPILTLNEPDLSKVLPGRNYPDKGVLPILV